MEASKCRQNGCRKLSDSDIEGLRHHELIRVSGSDIKSGRAFRLWHQDQGHFLRSCWWVPRGRAVRYGRHGLAYNRGPVESRLVDRASGLSHPHVFCMNLLPGSIPEKLGGLKALMYLNLSWNLLSGEHCSYLIFIHPARLGDGDVVECMTFDFIVIAHRFFFVFELCIVLYSSESHLKGASTSFALPPFG